MGGGGGQGGRNFEGWTGGTGERLILGELVWGMIWDGYGGCVQACDS